MLALFDGRSNIVSTLGPGDFLIYRDGSPMRQVSAAFALFKPDSGNLRFYLISMAVGVIDAPGMGNHSYQITHSNGQGVGGVYLIVTELSK